MTRFIPLNDFTYQGSNVERRKDDKTNAKNRREEERREQSEGKKA